MCYSLLLIIENVQNHCKKWEATGEATGRPLGRPLGGHWEATVIMPHKVLAVIVVSTYTCTVS